MRIELKSLLLNILFIFFVCCGALAQSTFHKAYGNVNGGRFNSVTIMDDGNIAFAGWYDVETLFTAEFYLLISDMNGDSLWTRTYGARVDSTANRINGSGNEGFHAEQTKDGGFIFSGERHEEVGGTSDVFLVRTDRNGQLLWSRTYGDVENEYGFAVKELEDGSFAIGGFTESYGAGARDFYLMKLDTEGDTLWTGTYGGTSLDLANDLLVTEDNGFLLAGYSFSFGAGNSDALIIKTDASGNIEWQFAYGGPDNDLVHDITPSADGGYVLVGETESFGSAGSDLYIIRIDRNGQLLWSRTLGGELSEFGNAIIQTNDGGYVIAGSTESFGAMGIDAYLVKVDSEGEFVWSHNYGAEFDDNFNDVKQVSDGGFIACGDTRSFGAGNLDAFIVKTDHLGRVACSQAESEYFSIPVNTIVTPVQCETGNGTFLKRLTTLSGFTNTTQTDICEGIVSTDDIKVSNSLDIYPNPVIDQIKIHSAIDQKIDKLECFNLMGEKVFELSNIQLHQAINIANLPAGSYLLRANTQMGSITTKFIKL